jgi:hypothetical protein
MRVSRSLGVLSFLAMTACAVGIGLDPWPEEGDGGRDSSVPHGGGVGGGSGGSTRGSSTQTTGPGGSGGAHSGSAGSGQAGSNAATGSGGASGAGASVVDGSGLGGATGDAALGDVIIAVDTSTGCVPGQKVCGGRCVIPDGPVGCDLVRCDPCPSPAHSVAHCTGSECDFSCLSGYQRSGAECVPSDGGGAGGGGGSSSNDAGKHCVASQCSGCIPVIQAPCCKADDTCGCQYPFFPCM